MEYWLPEEIWAIVKGYLLYKKNKKCCWRNNWLGVEPEHLYLTYLEIVNDKVITTDKINAKYLCSACWYDSMCLFDEKKMKKELNLTTRKYHILIQDRDNWCEKREKEVGPNQYDNVCFSKYHGFYLFDTSKKKYNEEKKNIIKKLIDDRKKLNKKIRYNPEPRL